MLLTEFWHKEPEAYQDLPQDNSQPQLGDLRKSRLTLRQLNKLRMMYVPMSLKKNSNWYDNNTQSPLLQSKLAFIIVLMS